MTEGQSHEPAVSNDEFDEREDALRARLIAAQLALAGADTRIVVELNSFDRRAANHALNVLHKWLDPRHIRAVAVGEGTEEDEERPYMYRYWKHLPADGRVGVFLNGWSFDTIRDKAFTQLDELAQGARTRSVLAFEEMLAADGASILKLWLDTPCDLLAERTLAAESGDDDAWSVSSEDRRLLDMFVEAERARDEVIATTDRAYAPWLRIASADRNHCALAVGEAVATQMEALLEANEGSADRGVGTFVPVGGLPDLLARVDLSPKLKRAEYERQLDIEQKRLHRLARRMHVAGISTMLAFEGWDAAGKGGAIRRLTAALDAVHYDTVRIAAPDAVERKHHHLWRFWTKLPRRGEMTIFDRTWYGRVLVERVEGFATEAAWRRSYAELNVFEQEWTDAGNLLLKFWLHIDPDEQLERFEEREETPWKRYKITEDDYRNREKWDDYEAAVNEMIARTDTPNAPWHVVPANNKKYARVAVIRAVSDAMEAALSER